MKSIPRPKLVAELKSAFQDNSVRLIHICGITGSGKTNLVREHLPYLSQSTYKVDCKNQTALAPDLIVRELAKCSLSVRQFQRWSKCSSKRFGETKYSRSHYADISGTVIAGGDIIFGDKIIQKSEEEIKQEKLLQARIGLEELTEVLRQERSPSRLHRWMINQKSKLTKSVYQDNLPRLALVLDGFENIDLASELVEWLQFTFIEPDPDFNLPIVVITVSRLARSIPCPKRKFRKISVGRMEPEEAESLLVKAGVEPKEYRSFISNFTRNHALSLVLASRVAPVLDLRAVQITEVTNKIYEELVTEFLLRMVIESEQDRLVAHGLKNVPIFRLFTVDALLHLLDITPEQGAHVINGLKTRGFVEQQGLFFKYHDLLRSLTLEYLRSHEGKEKIESLHRKAAHSYQNHDAPLGFDLVYEVEPFYHLFQADKNEALEYFEPLCKYALDRGDRVLSNALLQQIDFDAIPRGSTKGWYLLRFGGYYRQFRRFPEAIEIFEKILHMVGRDQKLKAYTLNNIGWCYLFFERDKNVDGAITHFEESNRICEDLGLQDIIAMNLNNIGIAVGGRPGEHSGDELEFYERSLAITETDEYRNPLVAAMSFRNIGNMYKKMGNVEKSLEAYERALDRYRQASDIQGEGIVVYLKALLLEKEARFPEARAFLDSALRRLEESGDPYYLSENLFALARVLEKLKEFGSMQQCLTSMCIMSLCENWTFHEFMVGRLLQFSKYLCAAHGPEFAAATLESLIEPWQANEFTSQIEQFPKFINQQSKEMSGVSDWRHRKSSVMHQCASPTCRPQDWERVELIQSSPSTKTSRYCKKCF